MYIDLKEEENPCKTILGNISDADLFKELHTCCNPNCLTIAEVKKRYQALQMEIEAYRDQTGD